MQFFTNFYTSLAQKYGKKPVIIGLVLLLVALVYFGFSLFSGKKVAPEETPVTATVRPVSLYTISQADDGTAVRTADGNAFIVRAESGGRVERIAKVGDTVARGAVVAQVENSAERALVLQAQGAYEGALAVAGQSTVGQGSADEAYKETIVQSMNTWKGAFATADDILRNTVDRVFSQPDSKTPGLKIDGANAPLINRDRVALESAFTDWKNSVNAANSLITIEAGDAFTVIDMAEATTKKLSTLIVTLTSALSDDDSVSDTVELTSLRADFASARSSVNNVLASLSGARNALTQAEAQKKQADIAGTNGDVSLADAQVKQALGALESARASLGKTAIKTPVAGTVTGVSISVGDIINPGSDVVFVASDAEMETGDTVTVPLTSVKFTPSKAYIFTVKDGKLVAHEVTTGAVTTKSITISGSEGIDSIVLDVRGLKEGDVVTQ